MAGSGKEDENVSLHIMDVFLLNLKIKINKNKKNNAVNDEKAVLSMLHLLLGIYFICFQLVTRETHEAKKPNEPASTPRQQRAFFFFCLFVFPSFCIWIK